MYELQVEGGFAAAHFLREYKGKCENLHGHNWKVEVRLHSQKLDGIGMVMDFRQLKAILGEVLEKFDHRCLNELEEFRKVNPTTENCARIIYTQIASKLPDGVSVCRVTCWENEKCAASYFE